MESSKKRTIKGLLNKNLRKKENKAILYSVLNPQIVVKETFCEKWGSAGNPNSSRKGGCNYYKNGKLVSKPSMKKTVVNIDNIKNIREKAEKAIK